MALGILTNTGISLGNIDIALDYLSDPSEFEPELAEVKSTIYKKEDKKHVIAKKNIVKPKLTEQALLNMFSIVPNKKDSQSDINIDTDITMKDSSDFDVDFDDMDFDFDTDDEQLNSDITSNSIEYKSNQVTNDNNKEVSKPVESKDIMSHIDMNILQLVESDVDDLDDTDIEDMEDAEEDNDEQDLFSDDIDDMFEDDEDEDTVESEEISKNNVIANNKQVEKEQDLFSDDIDDMFEDEDDEDEESEQDLFSEDIDDMFEDDEDEEEPAPIKQETVKVEAKPAPIKLDTEEDDDLFLDDEDDLFIEDDDSDDLFADTDDDMFDFGDEDEEQTPVNQNLDKKQLANVNKPIEVDSKQVVKKEQPKEVEKPQQQIKSAAEIELELLRKQLAEKDKQINQLIQNDKQAIKSTESVVKATAKTLNKAANTVAKAEDNIDKLLNQSENRRTKTGVTKEVQGSPYDKYTVMTIDALYKVVKDYMIIKGVRKGPLDVQMLNDKFGVDNIKKLTTKHYLIKTKKGVTVGL